MGTATALVTGSQSKPPWMAMVSRFMRAGNLAPTAGRVQLGADARNGRGTGILPGRMSGPRGESWEVMKFGGSTVGNPQRLAAAIGWVRAAFAARRVAVVV